MTLDPRLNAYRPDLADARLVGRVEAEAFVEGEPMEVASPLAPLRGKPQSRQPVVATLLRGEPVLVFEEIRDPDLAAPLFWVQSELDGYVGYAERIDIERRGPAATHRVIATRSPLYPWAHVKAPTRDWAPMGSTLALTDEPAVEGFRKIAMRQGWAERWIYERHVAPLEPVQTDWVAFAEKLIGVPYLWGGDSAEGVDCSGLIQTAMECVGRACPRDSDMQEAALGAPIDLDGPLRRGDLVFWRGHVGVMRDGETLLHANAWAMAVASEPLVEARKRIAEGETGSATSARRP
ncbi:MAG: NlpC/P60 family protein [Pseudomonadota bacterium]